MSAIPHSPNPYLTAFKSDGTKLDSSAGGVALVAATTYYVPLGGVSSALIDSVHVAWDALAILTITVEDSNNPDATVFSAALGEWIQENPSTSYVAGSGGFSVVNLTVSVAGGTAGGCLIHLGNLGALRGRLKVVVGGTGGQIKLYGHAKG